MLEYFADTFAPTFSAALFLKNLLLIYTFAAVAGFVLLNVAVGHYRDIIDAKEEDHERARSRRVISQATLEPSRTACPTSSQTNPFA